ncbi:hypothetical protein [Neisseria musculi]|uniref:hypothetical protein n=1 Tax=Neisseria musculi TaxID=1815583 RepID=UPI00360FE6E6
MELAEQALENKKLSKSERKLLNQYRGIEYDALLGAALLDVSPEHFDFKVKNRNGKTGIMVLRDNVKPEFAVHADGKPVNIEVKLRLIKSKGKWLIDGVGNEI